MTIYALDTKKMLDSQGFKLVETVKQPSGRAEFGGELFLKFYLCATLEILVLQESIGLCQISW